MFLRKTCALVAVGALVLASILVTSSAATAAPNPPTIDQTFPDPWITDSIQPPVQGTMDLGTESIEIEASTDGVNYSGYCSVPTSTSATVWFCNAPDGHLALGLNYLRAVATDGVPESSAPSATITITVVRAPTITSPANDVYTNDYQPTFQGTSDGTYFDVYTSDFSTHFCGGTVVNQSWNCTSGTIPDGDYTYLVETTFGATSIYSSTRTLHIDTVLTPANTDISGPPGADDGSGKWIAATSAPNPTISGTSEPFATITMWQNYTEVGCQGGSPVADYTGAWSCSLAAPFTASGVYVFGSQQTDPAGNTNVGPSPDEQLQLTYTDTTPPAPPVVTSPIGTLAGGANVVNTKNPTPIVTGTGEPGATLNVVGNTCMTWPTIVDSGGHWSCQLTTPMTPDGTYDVFFGLTDAALNASALASPFVRFALDTQAPGPPTVLTPSGHTFAGVMHAATTGGHTIITGTGENGATVHVVVGGSTPITCNEHPVIVAAGKFRCTVPWDLDPGVYNFSFYQTDRVGNSGTAVTLLRLTVSSPPTIPTLGLSWFLSFAADTGDPMPGQNVTLTGSDLPPGARVSAELHSTPTPLGSTIVTDDGTFVLNTVIPNTVEPGAHHYVVTVTPSEGEPQTAEIPVTVRPPAPPTISQAPASLPSTSGNTPTKRSLGARAISAQRDEPASPNTLSRTIPTLQAIAANPIVIGAAAGSSLALLFLVAFPAEILNSTLDENYERVFGKLPKVRMRWLDRLRGRMSRAPMIGGLGLTTVAALILSFADPHFGFDLSSLRLFLACAIGMFVLGYVANLVTSVLIRRRWSISSVIELQPFGLLVALAGVILSRVLDFAPGLLIGLVLALSITSSASLRQEARAVLVWAGIILGLAVACWVAYSLLSWAAPPATFAGALVNDSLVAVATEGISGLIIGLLPIGFLDGRSLYRNSRWQWLATYTLALIAFFVIVVPSGALWGDINGPFWIWLAVLLAFAALCCGVYLWFRLHPGVDEPTAGDSASEEADRAAEGDAREKAADATGR